MSELGSRSNAFSVFYKLLPNSIADYVISQLEKISSLTNGKRLTQHTVHFIGPYVVIFAPIHYCFEHHSGDTPRGYCVKVTDKQSGQTVVEVMVPL